MKKGLHLITLGLILSSCFQLHAQQQLTFSKQQMYADFDTLVATIHHVSPHVEIKKVMWNYDMDSNLQLLRMKIDTVQSDLSYFLILTEALNLALDMHTSLWTQTSEWAITNNNAYRTIRNAFRFSIGNIYHDGKYYVTYPFTVEGDTIFPGTIISGINGKSPADYLAARPGCTGGVSYDGQHGQFYYPGFFRNIETIFSDSIDISFTLESGVKKNYTFPTQSFTEYLPSPSYKDTTRVELWMPEKILYIRLPEMEPAYTPFLNEELNRVKPQMNDVEKIIIDIRNNPGGQDTTWMSLFAELIDRPISYHLTIDDYRNSFMTKERLAEYGYTDVTIKPDTNPILAPFDLYTILETDESLVPASTSLHFKGNIYLLAENHYSAAGSAVAVANADTTDQILSVGRPTGYFLGIGFSPLLFTLPNTGLVYRIAPSIDVTNVHQLDDLKHDNISIEVPFQINYYKTLMTYSGDPTNKAFLLQHDPFIQAVLKQ